MKKQSKGKLVAKSFPEMGALMPAHMGSQSDPPNKTSPFDPDNPMGTPNPDRGLYQ